MDKKEKNTSKTQSSILNDPEYRELLIKRIELEIEQSLAQGIRSGSGSIADLMPLENDDG